MPADFAPPAGVPVRWIPRLRIRRYEVERAVYAILAGASAIYAGTWSAWAGFALGVLSWSVASISDRAAEGAAIAASRLRSLRHLATDPGLQAAIDLQLEGGRTLVECSGKLAGRSAAVQIGSTLLAVASALATPGGPLAGVAARANEWLGRVGASPRHAAIFGLLAMAYTIWWRGIYRPSRWQPEARRAS